MVWIYQIAACVLLIGLGAFFAGSETGIYRLSRFRLRLGIEQKQRFFGLLGSIMDDSGGLVFSMLIGNNLVHYLTTIIVTVMFLKVARNPHAAELYATVLLAPVLFVFSEVIPKNVFYHRPDVLMPRFAPLLWFFHRLFRWSGCVWLLRVISQNIARLLGVSGSDSGVVALSGRGRIKQIIRETREEGILSSVQNEILNRLVNIDNIVINSVMTPLAKSQLVDVNTNTTQLTGILRQCPYTRLPVYRGNRNSIIGFINIYEVLTSGQQFQDLAEFVKPIQRLSARQSVVDAMNEMLKQNEKIVLVVAEPGHRRRVAGLVTMKDLVEEVTGELAQW